MSFPVRIEEAHLTQAQVALESEFRSWNSVDDIKASIVTENFLVLTKCLQHFEHAALAIDTQEYESYDWASAHPAPSPYSHTTTPDDHFDICVSDAKDFNHSRDKRDQSQIVARAKEDLERATQTCVASVRVIASTFGGHAKVAMALGVRKNQ